MKSVEEKSTAKILIYFNEQALGTVQGRIFTDVTGY